MAYVMLGTTDEHTQCESCGRPELRGTVVLGVLDADGNVEGVAYFGSTCAARALGRPARWGSANDLRNEAEALTAQVRAAAENARDFFAYYGYDTDIAEVAALYREAHARAMWAPSVSPAGWRSRAAEAIARHRAALVAAERLGL